MNVDVHLQSRCQKIADCQIGFWTFPELDRALNSVLHAENYNTTRRKKHNDVISLNGTWVNPITDSFGVRKIEDSIRD